MVEGCLKKKTFTNACVLFTCKITLILLFIPSLFTGFFSGSLQISVIDFNHFLLSGIFRWCFLRNFLKLCSQVFSQGFQRCLLSNFLKICSQVFSQGFSEVSVKQFLENLFTGFFTGFFTGLFQSQVFSQGPKF